MPGDVTLTQRQLRLALLERQLLLERASLPIPDALERVAGLQTQYAPSGYVGLWTRLEGFRREDLDRALEDRSVVQATLMRSTIHLVSRADFWRFSAGIRRARREWALKVDRSRSPADAQRHAAALRAALADGPRRVSDLGGLASGFVGEYSLWLDLVRVPPSGTWERRRADILALAEDWLGRDEVDEEAGLEALVRSYLGGFGPAPVSDIATWAGVPAGWLRPLVERLGLRRYLDEAGKPLWDLPDALIPEPPGRLHVRFLPHWDANLLVHVRRTGIVPEEVRSRIFHSKNPFSVGTYLVDGVVAGGWSVRDGRVRLEAYRELPARAQRELRDEADRLDRFHHA